MKKKTNLAILYVVLTVLSAVTLSPLAFLFINSFKTQSEIIGSPTALPEQWNIGYIIRAAGEIDFFRSLTITFVVTVLSVALIVLVSSLAGWIIARSKTRLSSLALYMFTAAMLIPFQAVMYPLLSIFETAGLKNITGLIIMYGGFGLSLSVFLYHGFAKSIPRGIEEAALIDGAGAMRMFFSVIFPLMKSTTATVIILNALWIWNDYLLPFLVIGNGSNRTLTLELYFARMTAGQFGNPWELIFPAVLISIVPIVTVFLFLQKYIVRGVADGAVKG
ncbi:MAG: carbohydrate ABC transporter permease [Ruminococcaceae bacterium]|nr:carbohydrate ABC transporter permease [Oscillospiraceae bacterium]